MVVSVDRIRGEYERVEDRLYTLRCAYGYSNTYSKVFRSLEARARRLDRILRNMEEMWGLK
ncbi:MAG: hypothetical protein ACOX4G_01565 [Limnochordia bacterium]|jgi:hypothetical protein